MGEGGGGRKGCGGAMPADWSMINGHLTDGRSGHVLCGQPGEGPGGAG